MRIDDYFSLVKCGGVVVLRVLNLPVSQSANSKQWMATLPASVPSPTFTARASVGTAKSVSGVMIQVDSDRKILIVTNSNALASDNVFGQVVIV